MLRGVGDPKFVHVEAMELPVDEIIGGSRALQSFHTRRTGKTNDSRFRHQHRDQSACALDIHADGEFGMDTPVSVGATGGDMDLPDEAGEPEPAELCRAGRAFSIPVVASLDTPRRRQQT